MVEEIAPGVDGCRHCGDRFHLGVDAVPADGEYSTAMEKICHAGRREICADGDTSDATLAVVTASVEEVHAGPEEAGTMGERVGADVARHAPQGEAVTRDIEKTKKV